MTGIETLSTGTIDSVVLITRLGRLFFGKVKITEFPDRVPLIRLGKVFLGKAKITEFPDQKEEPLLKTWLILVR